ncbi:ABC transporter ATP-binding protein [Geobacter sp. DSM 9736]|uniref:ABC transporter ATP-binding protein n=1 Tax=Geobacter sp. DSM 9736 TaxID=1277350 RepID=UPI000B4FDBE1|nr:ABC transporter ATP-binding protein [Geobacter sp. DSM 9736]SNB44837.1 peptide/nickel transport system ATP-binding protein [Geobacter sp. DSM 9736]
MPNLLDVQGLSVHFRLSRGILKAVDRIDLSLQRGETLALVGESGCGKSMTAYSLMRLVPPPGEISAGKILFDGTDLLGLTEEEMRRLRGDRLAMIFQEPMTSLNPVFTIGKQIAEGLRLHRGVSRNEARQETLKLLTQVGIPSAERRLDDYPHQLSGGMRQRVMIAMALACRPQLLIADEPTTALDVTIQAQILELLDRLKEERGTALILITHDLGIVAEHTDRTVIMYAGRIMESAPTRELFENPLHPYTEGLLNSLPQAAKPGEALRTIPGHVPDLLAGLPGCGFCDRCTDRQWLCRGEEPPMKEVSPGHMVRCWKFA